MTYPKRNHANLQDLLSNTKRTENNCIEWQRYRDADGYGKWRINGEKRNVARLVCALIYGEPLSAQQALHSCDNPPCINPDHLRWGSHRDNNDDKILRQRLVGEKHPLARYTDAQILDLKTKIANGADPVASYKALSMTRFQFHNIKSNKSWSHIKLSD
jgi:hypothetical protein